MRLLDGLAYSKQPHFWMVFIWTKLIVFQNKVVGNLWRPRDQKDKKNKSFIVPMEYFFQVLFDPHRETLIRAMVTFFYSPLLIVCFSLPSSLPAFAKKKAL